MHHQLSLTQQNSGDSGILNSLPPGSELLLLICMLCGVLSWHADTFTERRDLVRLFSLAGIASMVSLVIWVLVE